LRPKREAFVPSLLHLEPALCERGTAILRQALTRQQIEPGFEKPKGYQAHHIVEAGRSDAAPARAKLAGRGVDINSASNGVFIPSEQHYGTFTAAYTDFINTFIGGQSCQGLASGLTYLANELAAGRTPWTP